MPIPMSRYELRQGEEGGWEKKENESGYKSKEEVAELYEFPDKDFWYKFIKQERIIRANALKKPKDER